MDYKFSCKSLAYFSRDKAQGPEVCNKNGWSNLL